MQIYKLRQVMSGDWVIPMHAKKLSSKVRTGTNALVSNIKIQRRKNHPKFYH